jgi:tRNA (mo5U34)-methyltransferase
MSMTPWGRRLRHVLRGSPPLPEPLMYRVHLFEELKALRSPASPPGTRILEIGPKDGLDSHRLASLQPDELVMIDLPEKRPATDDWRSKIACPHRYIERNFMYMSREEYAGLGTFDVIWCTGVLYHNPEQLRFLRKLYKLLNVGGCLVLESATWRGAKRMRDGSYVEIHYPQTYRNTGTITHLPTANAIKAWLSMVGFTRVHDSRCFENDNRDVIGQRYACLAIKTGADDAGVYYGTTALNPEYRFGDSV